MDAVKKRFIIRDSSVKAHCCTQVNLLPTDPPYEVLIQPYKKNRSLEQNNLMWMWLTEISNYCDVEFGLNCTPDDLKEEFQLRFLGRRNYQQTTSKTASCVVGTSKLNTQHSSRTF